MSIIFLGLAILALILSLFIKFKYTNVISLIILFIGLICNNFELSRRIFNEDWSAIGDIYPTLTTYLTIYLVVYIIIYILSIFINKKRS